MLSTEPKMNIVRCPYAPKGGLKIQSDNSETARDRMLVTGAHTGFRLVPTLMSLNDFEGVIALLLHFFTEFDSFAGRLCYSG